MAKRRSWILDTAGPEAAAGYVLSQVKRCIFAAHVQSTPAQIRFDEDRVIEDDLADQLRDFYREADAKWKRRLNGPTGREYAWGLLAHWAVGEIKRRHPEIAHSLPNLEHWGWSGEPLYCGRSH